MAIRAAAIKSSSDAEGDFYRRLANCTMHAQPDEDAAGLGAGETHTEPTIDAGMPPEIAAY
jgi:hypothetical protein